MSQKKKPEPADDIEESIRKYAFLKSGSFRCCFSCFRFLGSPIFMVSLLF